MLKYLAALLVMPAKIQLISLKTRCKMKTNACPWMLFTPAITAAQQGTLRGYRACAGL